jgi:mRNA-degrading endonuclease toxin of MazEF toxin-antitoxin module
MTNIFQGPCTPTRMNPSTFNYKATNVKLFKRFQSRNADGSPIVDVGSIWTLNLPEIGAKDRHGHSLYAIGEMAHKPERPYLVLTDKKHNDQTGLICVAPLTTFGGRFVAPPLAQGVCVEIKSTKDRTEKDAYEGIKLGFVSLANVSTHSVERLETYIHTISQSELQACKSILTDILGSGNVTSMERLFPAFDVSTIFPKKN